MSSFLNVGGSLVDLGTKYQYSEGISESDQIFYSEAERFVVTKAAESVGLDPEEVAEAAGRVRRARRAVQLAMTLAAVDGPIPIGDMLAIGVLGVYAGYEIYKTVETFV